MKLFIDLFSGLGGASHAFDQASDWTVIKIDSNTELLEYNRGLWILDIADVQSVLTTIHNFCNPFEANTVVVWASPPCKQFSWARADRHQGQSMDDFDLTLLDATRQIIEHLEPDYWIIENVHGAKPIFNEELERPPTQELGSIVMWGDFPLIGIRTRDDWMHRKLDAKGSRTLRANWRAKIPQAVSFGLFESLTNQRTLREWLQVEEIAE